MEVAIRPAGLRVAGVEVTNVNEALARVMSLPLAERAATIRVFNDDLIRVEEQLQDVLVRWKDIIDDGRKFGLEGVELENFDMHNAPIREAAVRVLKAREERDKCKTSMQKILSKKGARGQDFGRYITNDLPEKGKNFYGNLSSFFRTNIKVCEGILLLNTAILQRNYNGSPLTNLREDLIHADIKKVLKIKKEVEKKSWETEELVAEKLTALGLTIGPAGLLIKGVYAGELFPRYDDEPSEWEDVVVSSIAPAGEPMAASGVSGSGSPAEALQPVSGEDVLGEALGLDSVDFEQFITESGNDTTETLGPLPFEPSAGSSSSVPVESVEREATAPEPVTPGPVLRTPARASGRKREAPATYTGFGKSPRKAGKTSASSSPRKVVEIMECECDMAEPWKLKLIPAFWEKLSFAEKLEVLEPIHCRHIYGPGLYKMPCSEHFTKLCSLLSVKCITGQEEMVSRFAAIYVVVCRRTSFRLAWIVPQTKNYFLPTPTILNYCSKKVIGGKYQPSKEAFILPTPKLLNPVEGSQENMMKDGFFALDGFLQWIKSDKGLYDIFSEEIEMYKFHCRGKAHTSDGYMRNMYYSLLMQTVRADPVLFVNMVKLRGDRDTRLISIPSPGRYCEGEFSRQFYEGDTGSLSTTSALCDEVVFTGEEVKITYVNVQDGTMIDDFVSKELGGREVVEFLQDTSAHSKLVEFLDRDIGGNAVECESKPLSVHVLKSGTLVNQQFSLSKPRFSFSVNYVAVDKDGVCENGVPYGIVKEAHDTLRAPTRARFGDAENEEVFKYSVPLKGLGPLSDSLVCREPLDSMLVLLDKENWLKFQNIPGDRHLYSEWKAGVKIQVTAAWKQVQLLEKRSFQGMKSYFNWKANKGAAAPAEDIDYIMVSSDEEGENSQTPATPTPAPKKARTPLPSLEALGGKGKEKETARSSDNEDMFDAQEEQ